MFVEFFQGQYKDGSNGTRDFRMVSASFLILRILIVALFMDRNYPKESSSGQILLLASVTCFYVITRPYRVNIRCTFDILILYLLEILLVVLGTPITESFSCYVLIAMLLLGVPHAVLLFTSGMYWQRK